MNKVLNSMNAPTAIGPYSQAIQTSTLVFVSGQLPIDSLTGQFAGNDIEIQTKQSLLNVEAILKEAGLSLKDVVKTTVYLKDINVFTKVNDIYSTFFSETYPSRSAFQVAALPKDAKIEIECIASKYEVK